MKATVAQVGWKEKLAIGICSYFSFLCSFSLQFIWTGTTRLREVKGFKVLVWYFQQLCTFGVFPLSVLDLYRKWDRYIEQRYISLLVIHCFFVMVSPFLCSLQYVFHNHRHAIIELVNQTVKLASHFEKRA